MEQTGTNQCLVFVGSMETHVADRMVLHAVPLTSKINKKRYMPTHVFINGFQAEGLDRHSIALCEQLCCVRYGDLMRQVGKVSTFQMLKITLGMQIQLGMVGKYNE